MEIHAFFDHWGIVENPFIAEEARDDPVFERLRRFDGAHPYFEKVFGQPDKPSASVVFGEKGTGKTALRLLMEEQIAHHNKRNPDKRVFAIRYDDLNPILDRFMHGHGYRSGKVDKHLQQIRLADHVDALLSITLTEIIDSLTTDDSADHPEFRAMVRNMPLHQRIDLALLSLLYDQPAKADPEQRISRIRSLVRVGRVPWMRFAKYCGFALLVLAVALLGYQWFAGWTSYGMIAGGVASGVASLGLLGVWAKRMMSVWGLARKIRKDMFTVHKSTNQLVNGLSRFTRSQLETRPLPMPGDQDSRYQLTSRLLDVLEGFGYCCMIVLIDRVDEPALVSGEPEKMRSLIWPLFNNKFLQQDRFGVKMLLPIELRHLLLREDGEFFQKARLDKQNMIDRLMWSGTMLYDMCSRRLRACQRSDAEEISLDSLFDEDVSHQDLIDALEQMHQPRDAFKFVYQVISEHCSNVPQDLAVWRIPRLTLDNVRRQQSQRVQDLSRWLAPA